jgi:hypothetical protein
MLEQTAIISPVGFYSWDGVCLLRGTSWILNKIQGPLSL